MYDENILSTRSVLGSLSFSGSSPWRFLRKLQNKKTSVAVSDHFNYVSRYVAGTDVPIPTHYFVLLTSCKDTTHTPDGCPGWLDVLPFIIPHRPTNVESCPVSIPGEPGAREWLCIAHPSCHKSGPIYKTCFSSWWVEFYRCAIYRINIKSESAYVSKYLWMCLCGWYSLGWLIIFVFFFLDPSIEVLH